MAAPVASCVILIFAVSVSVNSQTRAGFLALRSLAGKHMTDPIADMIIRLKNSAMAGKEVVSMPMSKLKLAVAEKLKKRGYLSEVRTFGKNAAKTLELTLARTAEGSFRISDVKRVSKPGMRIYNGSAEIRRVRGGTGSVVMSTPKGVLFGDEARKENVGGEVLFEIW